MDFLLFPPLFPGACEGEEGKGEPEFEPRGLLLEVLAMLLWDMEDGRGHMGDRKLGGKVRGTAALRATRQAGKDTQTHNNAETFRDQ